eukprot:g3608.t1
MLENARIGVASAMLHLPPPIDAMRQLGLRIGAHATAGQLICWKPPAHTSEALHETWMRFCDSPRLSAGLCLMMPTPFGKVRFSWSRILQSSDGDSTSEWQFGFGGSVMTPSGEKLQGTVTVQVCDVAALKGGKKFRFKMSDGTKKILAVMTKEVVSKMGLESLTENSVIEVANPLFNDLGNGKSVAIVSEAKLIPGDHTFYGTPSSSNASTTSDKKTMSSETTAASKEEHFPNRESSLPKAAAKSYMPIARLNPYINRWTIKARVTTKGAIRNWSGRNGRQGSLFSVSLLDGSGTEIRATFFNDGATKYYNAIAQDKVYTFSCGRIKVANRAYTSISNQYEISFGADAVVCRCDEDSSIKKISFSFVSIAKLPQLDANRTVDIVGVIHKHTPMQSITSKKGNELQKRDLTLVDTTGNSVRCTVWGEQATRPDSDFENFPIIAIKGCKLSDYGGRSLSTYTSSVVVLNPENVEEATKIREWYDSECVGKDFQVTPLSEQRTAGKISNRKCLSDIKDEALGYGEKADWVNVKATVCIVRGSKKDGSGPWYAACPEEGNNKKVIETPDGMWLCEATQKTYPSPEYRYILPAAIIDSSGQSWVTLFNDEAAKLLGKTGNEMFELKDADTKAYDTVVSKCLWEDFEMRLRVKADSYNDAKRLRVVCARIKKLDYGSEARYLLGEIQGML